MLKVKNSKAYMIGHTAHDIEMVKNAKINTIAVTWGYNCLLYTSDAADD